MKRIFGRSGLFLALLLMINWSWEADILSAAPLLCQTNGSPLAQIALKVKPFVQNLEQPIGLTHASDHSGRLFVVEQKGLVWIIENGNKRETPFLDIRYKVTSGGELGLLGIAFHPKFSENHRFYVHYTTTFGSNEIRSVISEMRTETDPNIAYPRTEKIFMLISQPFLNHKGGNLVFGPDDYLYIGTGDGGSKNDPNGNGQNLETKLGKMLRINVDRRSHVDHPPHWRAYSIPPDNPFYEAKNAYPEIWAYGLRNPWRYSFDPLTGLLYAGDVGQETKEEIDVIQKGKNYGWNRMEGSICTPGVDLACQKSGLELPIFEYGHSDGTAVIGGYVYRGSEIPPLCGTYLYGDFGSGKVWGLRYDGKSVQEQALLLETGRKISSFGEDEEHELYLIDYSGEVLKIGQ
jgi:glucose/arabinose dehydrogenase